MSLIPSWRSESSGGARSSRGKSSSTRKPAAKPKPKAKTAAKRKPAAKGKAKPVSRAKAPAAPRELEQRHLDLIGLGLLALALYLGVVLYGGSDAGRLGEALQTGLEWLMGAGCYVVPMLLAGVGAALVLRPFVRYPGALNGGVVLLVAGILLALAAETAGLGPEDPIRDGYFQPDYFTAHGGAIGEVLYWASATLLQRAGAHIVALLLSLIHI